MGKEICRSSPCHTSRPVCNVRRAAGRLATPRRQGMLGPGGVKPRSPAAAQDQTCVHVSIPETIRLFIPDQRHSRINGIYMFNSSVQQLFCFLFLSFWLCACGGGRARVVLQEGPWEHVRFRGGWEAILLNGWQCASLYWQTRGNRPPQSFSAKFALFIWNIYDICACTVPCN